MRFTVKAKGQFVQQLQKRVSAWAATKEMAVRIRIPKELRFLYYQEYGVPSHPILPNTSKALAFPNGEGGTTITPSVPGPGVGPWPGIKPTRTVTKSLDEIHTDAATHMQDALREGGADKPELVKTALVEAADDAKAIIAGGLAADLPGTRPDNPEHPKQSGKLHGQTAAEVFDALAKVELVD